MEEINNFQQESDETLFQAWELFKELLMKCPHYLTEIQEHNETSRGMSTETSDGLVAIQAQLNNLGREIKKVNEKVYATQVRCEQCKGPHYTKDCPQKEEGKTLEEAYYTQFGGPFQGGGYRATALGYYQRNNANPSYQERRQSMEDTLSKFMSESVLQERGFGSLPSSTETNPIDQVKSISTIIEADSHSIRRIGSSQYAVSTRQNSTLLYKSRQMTVPFPSRLDNHYYEEEEWNHGPKFMEAYRASHINNTIPRKEKTHGFHFTCTLFLEDYIELNDLNEPFELKRNQRDDLMSTIEEGGVIEEFRTRDEDLDIGIDDYPSYYDDDKKIHIDCAHNLKFTCLIGFEFTNTSTSLPVIVLNVFSRKFS
ncbi:homeodomain-like protein [Tanacetum coccineum]